jgi:signal transduction histidine kinase
MHLALAAEALLIPSLVTPANARFHPDPVMRLETIVGRGTSIVQQASRAAALAPQDALILIRSLALALLLVLAFVEPEPTRVGLPAWVFIALFATYSLLIDLLGRPWGWGSTRLRPVLDLALAGGLYLLGGNSAGSLYTLVFLTVLSAAVILPLWEALFFSIAALVVVAAGDLIHDHPWSLRLILQENGERGLRSGLLALLGITLARRLTGQQTAARLAQHEAEHLAELDRLRGNFVAAVSHDLQTPLTAVRAGLGLLEASAADRLRDDEAQILTNSRRNVDRLGRQINDLVTLNQIEAEQFQTDDAPLDVRAVIAAVVAAMYSLIETRGQVIEVNAAEPLVIAGDQQRLEQALLNLVANAHHHTPPGTHITIGGRETPEGVLLSVTDDGPGIPDHARDRLFDR